MVGHATVREQVLQKDFRRVARPTEIAAMAKLVEQGMNEGAIGLSSGLEYDVASYSKTDEMVAVAAAAAKHGGFYMSHIRDEADRAFPALEEAIAIGQRAHIPVEHSHIKLGTVSVWGKAPEYVRMIEDGASQRRRLPRGLLSLRRVVLDDQGARARQGIRVAGERRGSARRRRRRRQRRRSPTSLRTSVTNSRRSSSSPRARSIDPVEMFIRIIREGNAANDDAAVIAKSMTEADIELFYKQPWVMVASDGGIGCAHPRGAGTFPRVLGQFVREKHWLTLPEAIRKMTSLPAQRLGLHDRGTLREGTFADLVLFDPQTVIDRSTFAKPQELPVGIQAVFVNGEQVWSDGRPTGSRPGRVLTH